jgi:hypothetical protein
MDKPSKELVGWVEAYGETQHPTSLYKIFVSHKIAEFHSLRGSTQPTGLSTASNDLERDPFSRIISGIQNAFAAIDGGR